MFHLSSSGKRCGHSGSDLLVALVVHFGELGSRLFTQLLLAKGLELSGDVGVLRHVGDDDGKLVDGAWIRLLLGTDFSEDADELLKSLHLLPQDVSWVLEHLLGKELVLDLGLLHVVSQWQKTEPVRNERVGLSALLLELEDLTEGSDCVVFGVVVLGLLALLLLDGRVHWVLDGLFDALETLNLLSHEVLPTVLGDHTNTVNGGLSNGRVLRLGVAANLGHNLWIDWTKEVWAEELNHVVKNEKKELLLLLGIVLGDLWKDGGNELLDKSLAVSLVSLEENTEDLSKGNLELILVLVLLLENGKVLLVESVVLVSLLVLLLVLGVVLDSVLRLLDKAKDFLREEIDAFWLKKTLTSLLDNLLEGLSLANKAVSFGLTLHCLDDVVAVCFSHLVNLSNVIWLGLLSTLDESWKSSGTGVSDVIASIELSESKQNGADLLDVLGTSSAKFFNEDNEHLNGGILLLDLVSHDIDFLGISSIWLDLVEDICELSSTFAFNSHLWFKGSHGKNGWEDILEVWNEVSLHNKADSLPSREKV